MNKDEIIEKVAGLISSREHYQRLLGQLALEYRKTFGGVNSLKELSVEIKERHGLSVSAGTLHNYSWVEDRLQNFEIPEDVPFRIRQMIAGTDNPEVWVDKLNEGASNKEVEISIRGEKPRPLMECPKCHFAFERPRYNEMYEKAKKETKDFEY